jgi:hypothetical protein
LVPTVAGKPRPMAYVKDDINITVPQKQKVHRGTRDNKFTLSPQVRVLF